LRALLDRGAGLTVQADASTPVAAGRNSHIADAIGVIMRYPNDLLLTQLLHAVDLPPPRRGRPSARPIALRANGPSLQDNLPNCTQKETSSSYTVPF
jgi:hypothetical protein